MKRLLILGLSAMILLAAVSGSVAFFTDSVATKNVVASGSISILQHEYERVKDSDGNFTDKLQKYTQKQTIYPSYSDANTNTETRVEVDIDGKKVKLMSDSGIRGFVDKIVTVENTGRNIAYVRMYIAVPVRYTGEGSITWLHLDKNSDQDSGWEWSDTVIANQSIGGMAYDIHVATNTKQLKPGETTAPSLLGFYLDSKVGGKKGSYVYKDENGKTYDLGGESALTILVATEATQAIVFENAYDALNTVFCADDTQTYKHHPWDGVQIVDTQEMLQEKLAAAQYDTAIALRDGEYMLPAQLPDGLHLSGWGKDVKVSVDGGSLTAKDLKLRGLTFPAAVAFTGHGEFSENVFAGGLTAQIGNYSHFEDCDLSAGLTLTGETALVTMDNCKLPEGYAAQNEEETATEQP